MKGTTSPPEPGYDARTENGTDLYDIERQLRAEPPTARYAREGSA